MARKMEVTKRHAAIGSGPDAASPRDRIISSSSVRDVKLCTSLHLQEASCRDATSDSGMISTSTSLDNSVVASVVTYQDLKTSAATRLWQDYGIPTGVMLLPRFNLRPLMLPATSGEKIELSALLSNAVIDSWAHYRGIKISPSKLQAEVKARWSIATLKPTPSPALVSLLEAITLTPKIMHSSPSMLPEICPALADNLSYSPKIANDPAVPVTTADTTIMRRLNMRTEGLQLLELFKGCTSPETLAQLQTGIIRSPTSASCSSPWPQHKTSPARAMRRRGYSCSPDNVWAWGFLLAGRLSLKENGKDKTHNTNSRSVDNNRYIGINSGGLRLTREGQSLDDAYAVIDDWGCQFRKVELVQGQGAHTAGLPAVSSAKSFPLGGHGTVTQWMKVRRTEAHKITQIRLQIDMFEKKWLGKKAVESAKVREDREDLIIVRYLERNSLQDDALGLICVYKSALTILKPDKIRLWKINYEDHGVINYENIGRTGFRVLALVPFSGMVDTGA
ncbi:hypothetical protein K490DRAFT_61905 [Saccharata proteae CBS 121410]|uniref:Uncharacterized protein n=1 Tax=Saccharata proteae CBS 121410 TaxID=1314787 RepID=A0A9P4I1P5_9PEZI|nr:hypothetical protein K490DRAFT_61905 [Saccharata proteae CBS 121410]